MKKLFLFLAVSYMLFMTSCTATLQYAGLTCSIEFKQCTFEVVVDNVHYVCSSITKKCSKVGDSTVQIPIPVNAN